MRQISSLRFRVALLFALFGALLSFTLCAGIFYAAHKVADHLVDEILNTELEDSAIRHALSPVFIPPNILSLKGFVLSSTEPDQNIPSEIKSLSPGIYEVTIAGIDYRALIADRNDHRYFMLFDINDQNVREAKLSEFLLFFALFTTVCSAVGGFWLAARIIAPITNLALQVSQAEPGDTHLSLAKLTRKDEVGELARAFDRFLNRINDFIERERYFTTDISHELRTPLAVILGAVEVMEQDEKLSPKQKERIQRIHRAAGGLSELASALLLLAHEYVPKADQKPCNLAEAFRVCIDKHQPLIGTRQISLQLEIIDEPLVKLERPLLDTVIDNLLRNALFNTQSGTILLRLEAERFIVRDTGLGIPQNMLDQIFTRHYKGASSSGSGIGLSIVKRVCDRYDWHISIASQEGTGTTVEIVFAQSGHKPLVHSEPSPY